MSSGLTFSPAPPLPPCLYVVNYVCLITVVMESLSQPIINDYDVPDDDDDTHVTVMKSVRSPIYSPVTPLPPCFSMRLINKHVPPLPPPSLPPSCVVSLVA